MPDMLEEYHHRRESLCRELCELMGWQFQQHPAWTGIRRVASAQAIAVSLDKMEQIIAKLKEGATHA